MLCAPVGATMMLIGLRAVCGQLLIGCVFVAWQERRRAKGTTFCELCSPILLLCFLVYGYCLSDVLVFPAKVRQVFQHMLVRAVPPQTGSLHSIPVETVSTYSV